MSSNNRKRLLKLIEILTRHSDMNHKLSINEIMEYLEADDISINNRKTLYDDLKVISDYGYEVEYDNGYYLCDAPFSLSEIKIILDSLHSLKNIDEEVIENIDHKLFSFISTDEEKLLQSLMYSSKHKNHKFIYHLEDALYAIENHYLVKIRIGKNKEALIGPCFMFRSNDSYYLYYHYENNDKLYKVRFDNISSLVLTDTKDTVTISKSVITRYISEGTNAFNKGKSSLIKFEICNPSDNLNNRLKDDFSNIIFTQNGFSIRACVNDIFFSKISAYGDDIKISDKDIADQYIEFLNKIIIRNS
ncbi:MAG: WYL domain-containing protein [Erysipelotrichaceae bacterium]|nr:WYL domain-containing protein [Erysipelotrichaceae bacterium]